MKHPTQMIRVHARYYYWLKRRAKARGITITEYTRKLARTLDASERRGKREAAPDPAQLAIPGTGTVGAA